MEERDARIAALKREINLLKIEEHRLLRLTSMEKEGSAFIGEMNYHLATARHKLRDASRDLDDLERADVASGFQLEQPKVLVRWGISEEQLEQLFRGHELRRVTDGYFVTRCTSLCGLSHLVGFHFDPRIDGLLVEFELFGNGYADPERSFREFQAHLEMTFGPPTFTAPGSEGFPSHTWQIKDTRIIHAVQERFGPAEYLRITKLKSVI